MKTVAVGDSNKKPGISGLLIFLLTIALAPSSGCVDKQEGDKIDLSTPSHIKAHDTYNTIDLGHHECTGSPRNCAKKIAGDCDAGGMQDMMARSLADEGKLTIVDFSDYYSSSEISTNEDVNPALLEDVKKALLAFDPKGKHAGNLTDWGKTVMQCGFMAADDSDYAELRALATRYGMVW